MTVIIRMENVYKIEKVDIVKLGLKCNTHIFIVPFGLSLILVNLI